VSKKAIDNDRVALSRRSRARARNFAIHYVPSTVYGHALRVMKYNLAVRLQPSRDPPRYGSNLPDFVPFNLLACWGESDKSGIMAALGEDVAWDEIWESLWGRE
jgi:hypothetical protein